jgi:hypothetical protein
MKSCVKITVVVDSEESATIKEIGQAGIQKIIHGISENYVVVDVYKGCIKPEMVCVNLEEIVQEKESVASKIIKKSLESMIKKLFK